MISDHNRVLIAYGFVCDSPGQVNGEENGVAIPPLWEEWSFEEETSVVEGLVSQTLGIECPHGRDYSFRERRRHFVGRERAEAADERWRAT